MCRHFSRRLYCTVSISIRNLFMSSTSSFCSPFMGLLMRHYLCAESPIHNLAGIRDIERSVITNKQYFTNRLVCEFKVNVTGELI